jgi:hypothetical protein
MPLDLLNFAPTSSVEDLGLATSPVVFPVEARHLAATTVPWTDEEEPEHHVSTVADTHKCIVRTDTSEIVGVVGAKYRLMRNEEYFSTIETAMHDAIPQDMWAGVQVRSSVGRGGAFCRREYVFPAYAEELKNTQHATKMGLRMIAWNSYDGGSSAGLMTGLIDFYCTNGLIVGKNIQATRARHSSGLDPLSFVAPLKKSIERTEEMVDEARRMIRTPLSADAALEFLTQTFSPRRAGQLSSRLNREIEERGSNVFSLLSALTYYSSHNSEEFPTQGRDATSLETLHGREAEVARAVASPAFRSLLEAA